MAEEVPIEPVFDPNNIGLSMDNIESRIPIQARRLSGSVTGEVTSYKRGDGFDIHGVRKHEYGDDLRDTDWEATASDPEEQLWVREHYKDVLPKLWIVTDALKSRYQLTPGYFTEQTLAFSAITALMRLARNEKMAVGVIASNDAGLHASTKPRSNRENVIIDELLEGTIPPVERERQKKRLFTKRHEQASQHSPNHLSQLLQYAGEKCSGSLVAVISGFRDSAFPDSEPHGWAEPLLDLRDTEKQNDILAIELTNAGNYELPEPFDTVHTDRGDVWVGSGKLGATRRKEYQDLALRQQQAIDETLSATGIAHVQLSTAEPLWATSLLTQLDDLRNQKYKKIA